MITNLCNTKSLQSTGVNHSLVRKRLSTAQIFNKLTLCYSFRVNSGAYELNVRCRAGRSARESAQAGRTRRVRASSARQCRRHLSLGGAAEEAAGRRGAHEAAQRLSPGTWAALLGADRRPGACPAPRACACPRRLPVTAAPSCTLSAPPTSLRVLLLLIKNSKLLNMPCVINK